MRFLVFFVVVVLHGVSSLGIPDVVINPFQIDLQPGPSLKVDIEKLSLQVYTQSDRDGINVKLPDVDKITELTSFNRDLKTFIYIHGWLERFNNKGAALVKDAILNISDVNVITLDWDDCANSIIYFTSVSCVEGVGNYLGQVLTTLLTTYDYSLDKVTLVGHSLGAHIAGHAGQYTNGSVDVIIGLDPAAPFISKSNKGKRLSEDDAQFVEVVHTSALGASYNIGDVDFWPNGGRSQPGCGLNILECAHVRAYQLYAESITQNGIVGRECDSYDHFKQGNCDDNSVGTMGGLEVDRSLRGDYYLTTNGRPPYSI